MPTQPTSLPELAENEATGAIADIYREMRRLTAAPMVALIWRHLATRPGVLEAVWRSLHPLYASGLLQDAAWRVSETSVTGPVPDIGRAKLERAGLDADAQAALARVLDAYNRVNPVNFIAVRVTLQKILATTSQATTPPTTAPTTWTPPPAIGDLPAMAPIAAFAPEIRRMLDQMNSDPRVDRSTVVPTLYRHLTGWPALIPLIHSALHPRFQSGEISRIVANVSEAMDREAANLARYAPPLMRNEAIAGIIPTLERFSSLIPEMVVVGTLLRRGVDQT